MSTESTNTSPPPPSTSQSFWSTLQQTALKELPKFNGDSDQKVAQFINAVEHIGTFSRLDASALHALATIKLGGSAFNWYDHNKTTLTTWDSLKRRLLERFQPSLTLTKTQLKTRVQQPGESLSAFYDDIIELCKQVDDHMPLHMIVDYLQDGVRDDLKIHIKRRLRTIDTELTPNLFLKIARAEEELHNESVSPATSSSFQQPYFAPVVAATHPSMTVTNSRSRIPGSRSTNHPNAVSYTSNDFQTSSRDPFTSNRSYRPCLICHRSNHRTIDCFQRCSTGCFKCGDLHHAVRQCPQVFQ